MLEYGPQLYMQHYCRAGVDLASVEVRLQNLSIDADIAVGARGEPTVLNAYRNKLEVGHFLGCSNHAVSCLLCLQRFCAATIVQVCIRLAAAEADVSVDGMLPCLYKSL